MPRRRTMSVLAAALATAALLAAPARAEPCGSSGYSYAGVADSRGGHGVRATLTALAPPVVERGHVAAWVGVGGPGLGPNGEDEWIQVGLSAFTGTTSRLYVEVTRPQAAPVYTELVPEVAVGESRRVAVLETGRREGWWRVWVDGAPVGDPVYLPGSHGTWVPIATAESWNGGEQACNGFLYRFDAVMVARRAGGGWAELTPGQTWEDTGYRVTHDPDGFVAARR